MKGDNNDIIRCTTRTKSLSNTLWSFSKWLVLRYQLLSRRRRICGSHGESGSVNNAIKHLATLDRPTDGTKVSKRGRHSKRFSDSSNRIPSNHLGSAPRLQLIRNIIWVYDNMVLPLVLARQSNRRNGKKSSTTAEMLVLRTYWKISIWIIWRSTTTCGNRSKSDDYRP